MWKAYQRGSTRPAAVKLTLAECIHSRCPCPMKRNFAAIPLFQDAFNIPDHPNPLAWPSVPGDAKPPLIGAVYKGESIDLRAWQKYFVEAKLLAVAGDRIRRRTCFRHWIVTHRNWKNCASPAAASSTAVSGELRCGIQRPCSRICPVLAEQPPASMPCVYPPIWRSATARRRMKDFRSSFRLYTALDKEPTLITGLVRISILAAEENTIAAGLQRRQWGDAELAKIITDLRRVRLMDDYTFYFGSERAFSNTDSRTVLRQKNRRSWRKSPSVAVDGGPGVCQPTGYRRHLPGPSLLRLVSSKPDPAATAISMKCSPV